MGRPIAATRATVDGAVDPVGEWVRADGDHGDYPFERRAGSGGLVLGCKTHEGLAGGRPGRWADMVYETPKHVGSGDLEWNATPLEADLEGSIPKPKYELDAKEAS